MNLEYEIRYFSEKGYINASIKKAFPNKYFQILFKLKNESNFITVQDHKGDIDKMGFPIFPINSNSNKPPYEYLLIDFERKLPYSLKEYNAQENHLFSKIQNAHCNESIN